jgi:hypothetical protein
VIADTIGNLKCGVWYPIKYLVIIFGMGPYPILNSQNYAHKNWLLKLALIVVMEDLEDCMQLGVATSPYTHRVVTWIPCNALISTAWACNFSFKINSPKL